MSSVSDKPAFDPNSLSIITFPHPGLRYVAKPIRRVDTDLKRIAARMFELMYEHRGVGLAATQVNLPIRMFIMNPAGEHGKGAEYVVLNPVLSRPRSNEEAEEGWTYNSTGNAAANRTYSSGGERNVAGAQTNCVMAVAGKNCYLNGASDGTIAAGGSNTNALGIGSINVVPTQYFYTGDILAIAICSSTQTAGQIAAASAAVALI